MTQFDFRAALSYAAASAVALLSTTMLFATAALPTVAHIQHVVA